jgi:hypothetical protein
MLGGLRERSPSGLCGVSSAFFWPEVSGMSFFMDEHTMGATAGTDRWNL